MNSSKSLKFNKHYDLEGQHALFSGSKYHWINYSNEKMKETFRNLKAKELGTELHELASKHIKLGIKMPNKKDTLCMFVNDAIGYKMESEQPLYYSKFFFGTADAISFRKNVLRISDLKTGTTDTHMQQLMVYTAFFCLEYGIKPGDIDIELRIYQNDEVDFYKASAEDIVPIMDKIVTFDKLLNEMNEGEY